MKNIHTLLTPLVIALALTACGGGGKKSTPPAASSAPASVGAASSKATSSAAATIVKAKYSVTITNLTAGQILSPVGYVIHKNGYEAFSLGMPASLGLEKLAESGDPADFIAEANKSANMFNCGKGAAVILAGKNETVTVTADVPESAWGEVSLTLMTMPVNTNDALTGLNAMNISALTVGQSMTIDTITYDAGTEKNTETAATVPGPAGMGEGFNAVRNDDVGDKVTGHAGVVTKDDGLTTSVLTNVNRWDNPIARITITRVAP
jgi:predicted small lipoprotein YifL